MSADPDLMGAVAYAVRDTRTVREVDGVLPIDTCARIAEAALAAAGRVLAARLRADAARITIPEGTRLTMITLAAVQGAIGDTANRVARWCGAEPGGDDDG